MFTFRLYHSHYNLLFPTNANSIVIIFAGILGDPRPRVKVTGHVTGMLRVCQSSYDIDGDNNISFPLGQWKFMN